MLALSLLALLSAAPTLRVTASVDGHPAASGAGAWVYARAGQKVVLRADLSPDVPEARVDWLQLEPVREAVDNTSPRFHFEPVGYQAVPIDRCQGARACEAEVEARRFTNFTKVPGTGVLAFQARATLPDGRVIQTPGIEAATPFGLPREAIRVAFRKDDTYLGYLTELFNTPYIFGSAHEGRRHQTDDLVGSDCADLLVYGLRRLGLKVDYTSSYGMDKVAPLRAVMRSREEPLRVGDGPGQVRPGDVLHFPASRHVAALYEDREPVGVLDENDLILHTCWAPTTLERMGDTRCFSYPIRALRPPRR